MFVHRITNFGLYNLYLNLKTMKKLNIYRLLIEILLITVDSTTFKEINERRNNHEKIDS